MIEMMTPAQQEAARQERLAEVGTLSECPFCGKTRVRRSDYIRCNPCAINWLDQEMHLPGYLSRNPAACRAEEAGRLRALASTATKTASSVAATVEAAEAR